MTILVTREAPIAIVRLDRPDQLNALSNQLMSELVGALQGFDADDDIGCIVVAGDARAFASGADIREFSSTRTLELYASTRVERWNAIREIRTPLVAAVSGYCFGGGCELAMVCDLIVASDTAKFGQPETSLGLIPGAGGTQRLAHAVGKAKAMDVILTGRVLDAREAEDAGLVARVVEQDGWLDEAKRIAHEIASRAPVAQRLAKEAVNSAFDAPLEAGLNIERKAFLIALGSEDAREGIAAFVEKRKPDFKGR